MEHLLKYTGFLKEKKLSWMSMYVGLKMENSICLISVHSFIGKPTEVLVFIKCQNQG